MRKLLPGLHRYPTEGTPPPAWVPPHPRAECDASPPHMCEIAPDCYMISGKLPIEIPNGPFVLTPFRDAMPEFLASLEVQTAFNAETGKHTLLRSVPLTPTPEGTYLSPGLSAADAENLEGALACPDGDPFHDHGDGCPSCDTHHCPACKAVYSGPDGCPACADEDRL